MPLSDRAARQTAPLLITRFNRLVLGVDQLPLRILGRVGTGYLFGLLSRPVIADSDDTWLLYPLFVFAVVVVRVVAVILRRVIPFEVSRQVIWAERRQLAKRFDSYQWQKLFWFGLGLLVHAGTASEDFLPLQDLTILCLLTGGLGVLTWLNRLSQLGTARASIGARSPAPAVRSDS